MPVPWHPWRLAAATGRLRASFKKKLATSTCPCRWLSDSQRWGLHDPIISPKSWRWGRIKTYEFIGMCLSTIEVCWYIGVSIKAKARTTNARALIHRLGWIGSGSIGSSLCFLSFEMTMNQFHRSMDLLSKLGISYCHLLPRLLTKASRNCVGHRQSKKQWTVRKSRKSS